MSTTLIDISVELRPGMVHWPGDPAPRIERLLDMQKGDVCNVSSLSLCAHTGTHMDAPLHFIRDGISIEQMPLEAVIGPARVLHIDDAHAIDAAALQAHDIRAGERILFKTRNSARWTSHALSDAFFEDFVYIAHDAARFLAERGVQTIGIDYLSVGGFHHDLVETHQALLGAGIWLIEGLNLANVAAGDYQLICLPLKIVGADGAPARAVLRPLHLEMENR